jgi:hypothetical protein
MKLFCFFLDVFIAGLRSATVVAKSEHWEVSAWKNRSPSGILPLEVVNCVLHREAVLPER